MKRYTFVCEEHKKTARSTFGSLCPVCRKEMKCIGDKKRIGHCGQFDKIERKTKNLKGNKPIISQRMRREMHRKFLEILEISRKKD